MFVFFRLAVLFSIFFSFLPALVILDYPTIFDDLNPKPAEVDAQKKYTGWMVPEKEYMITQYTQAVIPVCIKFFWIGFLKNIKLIPSWCLKPIFLFMTTRRVKF
ncbi:MAG TPA: hypothetical protein DC049_10495 [Spirochaetia bacterium]|nr:hypothetical protein [Spirochaetia bacterium]